MIIRIEHKDESGESMGYAYLKSMSLAQKYISENGGIVIDTAPTPKNKGDIIRLLRSWGSHPDNG